MGKLRKLLFSKYSYALLIGYIVWGILGTANVYAEEQAVIKIIHTTDIHSRVEEDAENDIIGAAKLKTISDEFLKDADVSLRLDTGDYFHGQALATLSKGAAMAELAGVLDYDAISCGNHEWHYGASRLLELEKIVKENSSNPNFSILCGNVRNASDGSSFFPSEYVIKEGEVDGKTIKIGVFGVIDPYFYEFASSSNVSEVRFTDMQIYSTQAVETLKSKGCQVVIGMVHTPNPQELAESVDGVDVWLSGHGHILINQEVTTPNGSKATVVENGYYLTAIGELTLNFDFKTETVTDVQATSVDYSSGAVSVKEDLIVKEKITELQNEQKQIADEVVGAVPEDLPYTWETIRTGEQLIGRLITGAYLNQTDADVAIENAGGIRGGLKKGDVTKGDLVNVFPFGNTIVTKEILGSDLLKILERSIQIGIDDTVSYKKQLENPKLNEDIWPEECGYYLQVGGMTVQYDSDKEEGSRILEAKINDNLLNPSEYYVVATNVYLAESSVYPELASQPVLKEYAACDEAMIAYQAEGETVIEKQLKTQSMVEKKKEVNTGDGWDFPIYFILTGILIVAIFLSYRRKKQL